MEKVIEVRNLSKKYHRNSNLINSGKLFGFFWRQKQEYDYVFENVSLDIDKGDVVGIIGPNGAGKSTFLKILSGITAPTEGEVIIHGKVASILELGIGFDPELTGYDNIFNAGQLLGFSRKAIRKNIDSIIEFSGITDHIYTPVKYYSSGMIMRLAYSLVTNVNADILLFDEILAVGDMKFSQKVIREIFQKLKEKRTILIVSHDINFIPIICNKIIFLDEKKLIYYGAVSAGISLYTGGYRETNVYDFKSETITQKNAPIAKCDDAIIDENKYFKLLSCFVKNEPDSITMNDEIEIEIKINKLYNEHIIDIVIIVFSLFDKIPVFTSSLFFDKEKCITDPGDYEVHCFIPPQFLNVGSYSLNLFVTIDREDAFTYNKLAKFFIKHDEKDPLTLIKSKVNASLIPALRWNICKI